MADFGGFRSGLEFGLIDLGFFVEGREVFLKLSSDVVDILLGTVKNESCIDVTILCSWSAVCLQLTEISSIKESPTVCLRDSF